MRRLRIALVVAAFALTAIAPAYARAQEGAQSGKGQKALYREGARLWPAYCGQCHKARPGGEFSPAEWDTIIMHMRTRSNFSGEQTRAMLQFLKSR